MRQQFGSAGPAENIQGLYVEAKGILLPRDVDGFIRVKVGNWKQGKIRIRTDFPKEILLLLTFGRFVADCRATKH